MAQFLQSTGTGTLSSAALAVLGFEVIESFKKVEIILKNTVLDREWPTASFLAEADRFELWAANLGLFVAGHGSLDYRVREAEYLAQKLARFLRELKNSLDDVIQICSGTIQEPLSGDDEDQAGSDFSTDVTSEDEDEDDESDIDLLLDGVRDPISRLFKVSTMIRNPSTRIGSSKAAAYRKVDEDTGVDFLQVIAKEDFDYVRSVFLEHQKHRARQEHGLRPPPEHPAGEQTSQSGDQDEVWEPIRSVLLGQRTGSESFLIARIAQANTLRRRQFAYWAQHRDKLQRHTETSLSTLEALKDRLPTTNLPAEDGRPSLRAMAKLGAAVPSVTTATNLNPNLARLEIMDDRSTWTVSEYAPSTWQTSQDVVDFPPPPKLARNTPSKEFFECPYCFTLCARATIAEKAWKAHLIHDLRPYICTYEHCNSATQLYDSRHDWVQHESSAHRRVWRCLEHSSQVFTQLEEYKRHLGEKHAGLANLPSYERIIQASESVLDGVDRSCPICSVILDSARGMEGHIALHLERLARFSFPRSMLDDENWSNADSDRAEGTVEDDSRVGDFADSDVASEVIQGREVIQGEVEHRLDEYGSSAFAGASASALTEEAMLKFIEEMEEQEEEASLFAVAARRKLEAEEALRYARELKERILKQAREEGKIKVPQVASGRSKTTVQVTAAQILAYSYTVSDIALAPDDRYLASCGNETVVRIRDLDSPDEEQALIGHKSNCHAVAWALDGFIATGDNVGTIKFWSTESHQCLLTNQGHHSAAINGLTFSPDSQCLLSTSSDKISSLWMTAGKQMIRERMERTGWGYLEVYAAGFTPDGKCLVMASDKSITFSDNSSACENVSSFPHELGLISDMTFTVDSKLLIVSWSSFVDVWDISSGGQVRNLERGATKVTALAMSHGGLLMASATADGLIKLWDTESWTLACLVPGHTAAVNTMLFSSDDQRLFSCSDDKTVRVWNLSVAKQEDVLAEPERRVERQEREST